MSKETAAAGALGAASSLGVASFAWFMTIPDQAIVAILICFIRVL
jgi:hypothetical protein